MNKKSKLNLPIPITLSSMVETMVIEDLPKIPMTREAGKLTLLHQVVYQFGDLSTFGIMNTLKELLGYGTITVEQRQELVQYLGISESRWRFGSDLRLCDWGSVLVDYGSWHGEDGAADITLKDLGLTASLKMIMYLLILFFHIISY